MLSFFRGAELADPHDVLEKPGKNSRFARYMRFKDKKTVSARKRIITEYVEAAIDLEASGKKARPKAAAIEHPVELTEAFSTDAKLKKAFAALTPGRQSGYLIHFTSAKQSKTRKSRIEKCTPKILKGKGWNER